MTFINRIISYLTNNGTIDKTLLFEVSFTDSHDQGLFGVFHNAGAGKVITLIDGINQYAWVRTGA
ncbi:MAG: hypothetical protein WCP96_19805 [Methylococcaceae bacterium]